MTRDVTNLRRRHVVAPGGTVLAGFSTRPASITRSTSRPPISFSGKYERCQGQVGAVPLALRVAPSDRNVDDVGAYVRRCEACGIVEALAVRAHDPHVLLDDGMRVEVQQRFPRAQHRGRQSKAGSDVRMDARSAAVCRSTRCSRPSRC
ncbi:hypothetical protein LGN19_17610 [Burkholderia sp. AU30198]|uniref:hypothetical protein n=1 Tax=Burkholderia sp. AU30198 TaxID=2879627 RepID=UPI001CF3233A|nr:hypothetical protein [Burkholderia sp. AU30198]MCA8295611.1 hypothetical protein [Burkholderia sp. AU30198]